MITTYLWINIAALKSRTLNCDLKKKRHWNVCQNQFIQINSFKTFTYFRLSVVFPGPYAASVVTAAVAFVLAINRRFPKFATVGQANSAVFIVVDHHVRFYSAVAVVVVRVPVAPTDTFVPPTRVASELPMSRVQAAVVGKSRV